MVKTKKKGKTSRKKSTTLKHQGVYVGGKRYTRFSQFEQKPPAKKSLGEKVGGGIKLAIL